jgi:hypothetical protein
VTPTSSAPAAWPDPDHCANHPDRETRVQCSSCGKPICPDCMVYSPVGIKCRECARLPKSALIRLKPERWVKAIAAALAVGTGAGLGYYLLLSGVGFFFFAYFAAIGIGYLVGEAVLRAAGYYHGRETALIALGGTVWAFLFPPLLAAMGSVGFRWQAFLFSVTGRGIIGWLMVAIAGYVAYQRNR